MNRGAFLETRIPDNAVVWAGVSVVFLVGLARTELDRPISAVGDNPIACRPGHGEPLIVPSATDRWAGCS